MEQDRAACDTAGGPDRPLVRVAAHGDFSVSTGGNCHGIVNPVIDVQTWLSHSISSQNYGYYEDPQEDAIYDRMLHETDVAKQRALAYQFDKRVLDEQVHYIHTYWWNRIVPLRSYVHGWKIGPSHYTNQDLSRYATFAELAASRVLCRVALFHERAAQLRAIAESEPGDRVRD